MSEQDNSLDELKTQTEEEKQAEISRKAAVEILWNRGNLDYKLDALQREMKANFIYSRRKINTWLMSRRLGKSHTLCTLAIETCLKKPRSIVKYLSPEIRQTKTIINPIIRELIADAPANLKPEFKTQENLWRFPNGSEIHVAGSDKGGSEKLRGTASNLCIVDEAGFCDDLKYTVRTILLPTMVTTGGKLLLSSTPPRQSEHEFIEYVQAADIEGSLIKKTVYDCPRYSKEFIEAEILAQYKGPEDPDFKREYLVEMNRNEDFTVIPEFDDAAEIEIVKDIPLPAHYDSYVSVDYGVRDLTVALFAYYDFKLAKLVIQDELIMNGVRMNTKILAEEIRTKEANLWQDPYSGTPKPVYMRVSDNNLLLIQDLSSIHNLFFTATDKHNKEGFLNQLRLMISDRKIIISPRCRTLIHHLKYASWDKDRRKFKRLAGLGHADAVDALIYLIRNVVYSKNPYPNNSYGENFHVNANLASPVSKQASVFKDLFTLKKPKLR